MVMTRMRMKTRTKMGQGKARKQEKGRESERDRRCGIRLAGTRSALDFNNASQIMPII